MWPLVRIAVTIGNSIPSLRIVAIWRVTGWHNSTRRPPRMRIQNRPPFIIDRSSPGGGSWGNWLVSSEMSPPRPLVAPGLAAHCLTRYGVVTPRSIIYHCRLCFLFTIIDCHQYRRSYMFYWSLTVVNFLIHQAAPSPKKITAFVIEQLTIYSCGKCLLICIITIIEHSSFSVIDHVTILINHKIGFLWMG